VTRAEPVAGESESLGDYASLLPRSASLPTETPPRAGEVPGLYLGPFTSPRGAYWTFEAVRTLFPLRSCDGELQPDANGRGCFYHEIGRCTGPCVGATSEIEYSKLCADLVSLLRSGQAPQVDALRAKMQKLSDEWRFEEAAQLKEQLDAIQSVAARLQRLERMRAHNNVVIVQRARCGENGEQGTSVFLISGGVVRRHVVVRDWECDGVALKCALLEVYAAPAPAADYTAKTELDEMMILDRWLKSHGDSACCIWMNNRESRQWAANAVRAAQRWTRSALSVV
jgi:excinuclease UvrABC nuclease subunit